MGRPSAARQRSRERTRARQDEESGRFMKKSDKLKKEHISSTIDLSQETDSEPDVTDDNESDVEELATTTVREEVVCVLVEEGDIWIEEYFLQKQKEIGGNTSLSETIDSLISSSTTTVLQELTWKNGADEGVKKIWRGNSKSSLQRQDAKRKALQHAEETKGIEDNSIRTRKKHREEEARRVD